LAALSGINASTLKYYLRFLNRRASRKTQKRVPTRFTGLEVMAVIIMAELQREWDIRPEKSFAAAYWLAGHFVDQMEKSLAAKANGGFPASTFTAAFDPDESTGVVSQAGAAFMAEVAELMPSYRLAAVVFADQRTRDVAFQPVIDLYETLTGVDLMETTD
jgi:hypothetical protein